MFSIIYAVHTQLYVHTTEKKTKQTRDDDEFFFMGFGISN
jgi:hypothetical protein